MPSPTSTLMKNDATPSPDCFGYTNSATGIAV
jgi:hypothetical protein